MKPFRYEIPKPKFEIGQHVRREAIDPWLRGHFLRSSIRDWRRSAIGLLHGKHKMPTYVKLRIRTLMFIIDTAYAIQIVGVSPLYGHVNKIVPVNQCYLVRGQSHEGLVYGYTLLFRAAVPETDPDRINDVCIFSPVPCLLKASHVVPHETIE